MSPSRRLCVLGVAIVAMVAVSACMPGDETDEGAIGSDAGLGDPGLCVVVDMSVSPEKADLMRDLAGRFNSSAEARVGERCVFVRPQSISSGASASLLAQGWPDPAADGPRPVVWSPASSAWSAIVNQRLDEQGEAPVAPPSDPFMLTPLVIAMPQPMADALGYPETPVGFADILRLAQSPEGWGAFGHPEWGPFRLGKTNPNFSTSGLSALIAQYYAATGTTGALTQEDLARPEVVEFSRGVESAVVHYGDTTLTFLNNLYRNDARGTALTYASAVAVEEKSVIDYNRGDPDGVLEPGEEPRPPKIPLVAVYPKEGTLFSDNPFVVLDAPWVDEEQAAGAEGFRAFVQRPENQERVLEFGFRPGNPAVAVGQPVTAANGVDASQPATTLSVPEPPVMIEILDRWAEQRKSARVMLLVDVSGSMGEEGDPSTGETKLELAQRAAIDALDQFKGDDDVGLRIFSTGISGTEPTDYVDVVPIGPISGQREELASRIRALIPTQGTPLYTAIGASYSDLLADLDPARINALVVLSDGRNEDPANDDLDGTLNDLRAANEGQQATPVRVFPIAYGGDADLGVLSQIAEVTNAAAYDASDPRTISKVFTAVVSNF